MRFLTLFIIALTYLPASADSNHIIQSAKAIEAKHGGRVGVHIVLENGTAWSYRENERFPLNSTFKTLACATALAQQDAGTLTLQETVTVQPGDIVTWSPTFKNLVGKQVSLFDACTATLVMSDNAAVNILVREYGGPQTVTEYARSLGDNITRLDRYELALNSAIEDDPRDTTSPRAYVETLSKLLLGNALSAASREQLKAWMINTKVTGSLLRKHLPAGWVIADRSGAGDNGSRGIIAVIWPTRAKPFTIAIYMTNNSASFEERNKAIADIGKLLFEQLTAKHD
jgi:beta-lactamase class A